MKKIFLLMNCLLLLGVSSAQEQTWRVMPYFLKGYEKQYRESPQKAALAWFQDARFGLFIHWGPATLYKQGEWVMYSNKISVKDYEEKAREFKGDKFRAKDYVDLAVKAKMKYITFVVKHHDGFALWDSKATDYTSVRHAAAQRDFVKELAEECRKSGVALFIYYSIGIDWHHPYFMDNSLYKEARPHYKTKPEEYKYRKPEDFNHYMNFAKTQIMELSTMYGPIAGFWFDTVGSVYQQPEMMRIQDIYDMIHAIQPHALVVFKTGANGNEDFITGERSFGSLAPIFKSVGLPKSVQDAADFSWQSNKSKPAELNIPIQTLGWSYIASPNQRQKNKKEVMSLLEYCAQVNANLLLNIGPRPDGTILEENIKVLTEVGEELKKKGFPKVNLKDYMSYREGAKQVLQKEKENQTAN